MKLQKFSVGNRIAVIDENMHGIIISINGKTIQIEDENGFMYSFLEKELILFEQELHHNIRVKSTKESTQRQTKQETIKRQQTLEVDLHIHEITHSNKNMSNFTMLQKQLSVVKSNIQYAMKHHIQKIVFIHGVGKGVLKKNILLLLKEYPVEINDASYSKYGKGATEITIYKSKIKKKTI